MATNVSRKVSIIFEGDDRVSNIINGVSANLDSFSSKVSGVTAPLASLTDSILLLEGVLAALAVGGMALSVKAAGDFYASVNEIFTLLDITGPAIGEFQDDILEYAKSSTASIEDINESLYNAISAGISYDDALNLINKSEQLAVATKGELSDSTKLITQTLNAYADETVTAERVSDVYFTTIRGGVTRIDELSAAMGKATPLASALNIPIETLGASMIALTKAGLNTSEAVTTLTSLFTAFLKPPSQANEILGEQIDLLSANAIQQKGFEVALKDVIVAVDGDEAALSRLLGRKEALIAALILGVDKSGDFKNALDAMAVSAGSTSDAFNKMVGNLDLAFQNLINNVKALAIELGGPLLEDFAVNAYAIGDIFKGIGFAFEAGAFDPLYAAWDEFAIDFFEFVRSVGENIDDALLGIEWDDFIASVKNIGSELEDIFQAIFGEVDLETPEGLETVIQKVVDGFTALNNVVAGILDGLGPFIEKLSDIITEFIEGGSEAQELAGQILGIAKGVDEALKIVPALTGALNLLSGAISLLAFTRIPSMITALGSMGSATSSLITLMGTTGLVGVVGAASLAFGYWVGDMVKDLPVFRELGDTLAFVALKIRGMSEDEIALIEARAASTLAAGEQAVELVRLAEAMGELPSQQATEVLVKGTPEYEDEVSKILDQIKSVPETKETEIQAKADLSAAKSEIEMMSIFIETETGVWSEIPVAVKADESSIKDTKTKIEEIPNEKILIAKIENETELEIAKIKAQAETLNTMFEWQAKLEITEIEENMATIRTLSDNLTTSFESTGEVISALVGSLADLTGYEAYKVLSYIEEESARRDALLDAQLALTDAEIEWLAAKTDALERGEAAITIQMEGVYPELEMIMWKVMERVQIQATAEGLDLLL